MKFTNFKNLNGKIYPFSIDLINADYRNNDKVHVKLEKIFQNKKIKIRNDFDVKADFLISGCSSQEGFEAFFI